MEANPIGRGQKETSFGPNMEENESDDDYIEILHASEVARLQEINTDIAFPTGMTSFDEALLGGFTPGEVITVMGKPGHGKTSIMQSWTVSLNSAKGEENETLTSTPPPALPSIWFSYEVLPKPLWEKFVVMGASVDTPIYLPKRNKSGDSEWITEIIERGIKEYGIKLIAIDHIGFLKPPKGTYANASDAITHTVRNLKRLAVKHGLIIFLPVHVKKTTNTVMELEDIKDSAGIAQESDTVFSIERLKEKSGDFKDESRISLIKNRKTGSCCSEHVSFRFGRFYYDQEESEKRNEDEAHIKKTDIESEEEWSQK